MVDITLGELSEHGVLEIGDGYRTKRSEHGLPGFRILRVNDLHDWRIVLTGEDSVRAEFASKIGTKLSRPGDVLLSTKGTVGRVALYPEDVEQVVYSPQMCFFRVKDEELLRPRYLAYWFKSPMFSEQSSYRANGSDMAPYISLRDIRTLQICLPDIRRQAAIVEVLGALDDKIAANQRAVRLLDQRSAALVAESSQAADQVRLSDVLVLNYGKSLPASTRIPGPVDVYGSGGRVGVHNVALVNQPGIVLGRKGSVGAVYWADGPHYPIDTTYFVSPVGDTSAEVLYYVLRSMPLADLNSDSAVPGLNRDEAYGQWTRVPMDESARKVTKEIENAFELVRGVRIENEHLARTRDELLPLLMSGKLRIKDAEAVASEVL